MKIVRLFLFVQENTGMYVHLTLKILTTSPNVSTRKLS